MKQYQGIGLLSGTSMDGLDIVCCSFSEKENEEYSFEIVASQHLPFEEKWLARLKYVMSQNAETYAKTDVYFGHWLGQQVKAFIEKYKLTPDYVASHGQTIFHQPHKSFTAQIGDGESMVSYLNCPLVSNFRNKDVALKGQGAPLVALGEKYLFPSDHIYLNLGGFSNITFGERAFDVSPCNIVLNYIVKEFLEDQDFDDGGKLAASGSLDAELLAALNELPYYHQKFPKTLGWEWVRDEFLPILADKSPEFTKTLHTLVVHIAQHIAQAVVELEAHNKPMFITGGGRHNTFLLEKITEAVAPYRVSIDRSLSDEMVDFKEAIIFAFLGLRVLTGKATTLPSTTGASMAAPCGSIHLPAHGGYAIL